MELLVMIMGPLQAQTVIATKSIADSKTTILFIMNLLERFLLSLLKQARPGLVPLAVPFTT